jgi:hypothetical protein
MYVPAKPFDGVGFRLTHGELAAREYTGRDWMENLLYEPNVSIIPVEFNKCGFTDEVTETFKADYMRLLTMSQAGGIWIDSDILFWKPLEASYFNKPGSADTCNVLHITIGDAVYHSTGLVMASKERSIWKKAIELVSVSYYQHNTQSIASGLLNKISVNIADISYAYGAAINISDEYIYPLNVTRFDDIFDNSVQPGTWQTIGLHWYGGAEKARQYVHGMSPDTWRRYNNTLAKCVDMTGCA